MAGGAERIGIAEVQAASWLRVQPLSDPRRADLLVDLDRGEVEAIVLAQELNADLLIVDERMGRQHARRLGLTITGTLGVLLKAKELGYVEAVQLALRALWKYYEDGGDYRPGETDAANAERKQRFFEWYRLNDLDADSSTGLNADLDISLGRQRRDIRALLEEYFGPKLPASPFPTYLKSNLASAREAP